MTDSFFDYQHAHEAFFRTHGTKITYKKGHPIVSPHDDSPWVYFLVEGYVDVSFGFYDGSERLIGYFLPGMSFAKIGAFFDREDGMLQYCPITPVTVYRISQDVFLQELARSSAMNAEYISWLLKVQILLIERIVFLGQPTMRLRVLHWLMFMRKYYGETLPTGGCRIAMPLTHDTIGNFLHTTRESVGVVLRDLQARGVVRIEKKRIIIDDIATLETLAS